MFSKIQHRLRYVGTFSDECKIISFFHMTTSFYLKDKRDFIDERNNDNFAL